MNNCQENKTEDILDKVENINKDLTRLKQAQDKAEELRKAHQKNINEILEGKR